MTSECSQLDRRLNAFRDDLADARLEGKVNASRFVEGVPARIVGPVADILSGPAPDSGLSTQFLMGDEVLVFERSKEFGWVQGSRDSYVGYVALRYLSEDLPQITHFVTVPRTFVYPVPDLKKPRLECLSLGSGLAVSDIVDNRGTRYAQLATGGFAIASHLAPRGQRGTDYVAVAETLLGTPYLWGGTSAFGIDCSGLVQLSMFMAGRTILRDSDMQAASGGEPFDPGDHFNRLRRGDLVFWKGHVGIMMDGENLLHANGHTMMVSRENIHKAVARISYLYGQPTAFIRPI
jgi:cell wall-associated NlpC family hydrolase